MKYPMSFYQVFEITDPSDPWSFAGDALFEHDNLAIAHSYAYNEWLEDKSKAYSIIQPGNEECCRGGYGFAEE